MRQPVKVSENASPLERQGGLNGRTIRKKFDLIDCGDSRPIDA